MKTAKYYERKIRELNRASVKFWNAEIGSEEEKTWNNQHTSILLDDLAWAGKPPEEEVERLLDMVGTSDDKNFLRPYWTKRQG